MIVVQSKNHVLTISQTVTMLFHYHKRCLPYCTKYRSNQKLLLLQSLEDTVQISFHWITVILSYNMATYSTSKRNSNHYEKLLVFNCLYIYNSSCWSAMVHCACGVVRINCMRTSFANDDCTDLFLITKKTKTEWLTNQTWLSINQAIGNYSHWTEQMNNVPMNKQNRIKISLYLTNNMFP